MKVCPSEQVAIDQAAAILGPLAQKDLSIGARTTYRVGGEAALFVTINKESELEVVKQAVSQSGVEVFVLGNGSNTLVADRGFSGLCVTLGESFASMKVDDGNNLVWAGASLAYPVLARRLSVLGLSGLGWAVGIPGSVGGAVRMNAGGHGSETAKSLFNTRVVDLVTGEDRTASAHDLDFGYRRSSLGPKSLVLGANFAVTKEDRDALEGEIDAVVTWRRENQPGGRNGGSVFSNPVGQSAGRLIDDAGLKGTRIGSAEVSTKHANFILVDAQGSADDVFRLIELVREKVRLHSNIELDLELRLIGTQL